MTRKYETVFEGKVLSLNLEQASFPDGSSETLELIRHPGGAAVVALNESNEVCLIRHYRYAIDDWLWEIPAGRIEDGEEALDTAKRELSEEAGLSGEKWQSLTSILPSPGICDERIFLFQTQGLSSTATNHEPGEFIEIHWVPVLKAIEWVKKGKIQDTKTIIALLLSQLTDEKL